MCDRYSVWLKDAAIQNGPILPWSPVPSHCCKRDLGTGLAPTGYKLMRRVSQKQKGSALDLLNKRNGNFNGKRGIKKNVQRSYICSVMAGHHCCSARAFAVNPSRLPARPSGLRGLTAQRGQARRACRAIKCRTALARASRNGKEEMLIAKKLLDTRAPHLSWVKNKRSWVVSRTRPCGLRLKTFN